MIKNMDDYPYSLSLTYIFLNCSAQISHINLIFARFFSHCQYASDKYHKPSILLKTYFDTYIFPPKGDPTMYSVVKRTEVETVVYE